MKYAYAVSIRSQSVDRENRVIKGVAVITKGPAIGHGMQVDSQTLSEMLTAATTYSGGLKVVDRHTTGQDSIFSTAGVLKNFRIDGNILRADLHLLKSEAGGEKLMEMAEMMPDTFGLSVAFSGPDEVKDGVRYARCQEIYNAALVDVPAANPSGLFSAQLDATPVVKAMTDEQFSALTAELASLKTQVSDCVSKLAAKDADTELSSIKKTVTELSATVEAQKVELAKATDLEKQTERIAVNVAKQFAAATGTTPAAKPSPTGTQEAPEDAPEKYEASVAKHYAATKSKVSAVKLSIDENPKAYQKFVAAGRNLKFA